MNIGERYDAITNSFQPFKADLYWFLFDIFADTSGNIINTLRDAITGDNTLIYASDCKMMVIAQKHLESVQLESRLQIFSQYSCYVWKEGMFGMS